MKSYVRSALMAALTAGSLFSAHGSLESRNWTVEDIRQYNQCNGGPHDNSFGRQGDSDYMNFALDAKFDPQAKRVSIASFLSDHVSDVIILPVAGAAQWPYIRGDISGKVNEDIAYADWSGCMASASGSHRVVILNPFLSSVDAERINAYLKGTGDVEGVRLIFEKSFQRAVVDFPDQKRVVDLLVANAKALKGSSALYRGMERPISVDDAAYSRDRKLGEWMLDARKKASGSILFVSGIDLNYILPRNRILPDGNVGDGLSAIIDDVFEGSGVKAGVLIPVLKPLEPYFRATWGKIGTEMSRYSRSHMFKDGVLGFVDFEGGSVIVP